MGYTHHWRIEAGGISPQTWARITADARRLVKASPVPLAREHDQPGARPVVSDSEIRFNGRGAEGCEDFLLTPDPTRFAFCKTKHQGYDLVVCAVLAAAHGHAPDKLDVSSDGDADVEWEKPLAWAAEVLKRPVPAPTGLTYKRRRAAARKRGA